MLSHAELCLIRRMIAKINAQLRGEPPSGGGEFILADERAESLERFKVFLHSFAGGVITDD